MRWVVTGSGGQLGSCLTRRLEADPRERLLLAPTHAELDIADPGAVERMFGALRDDPPDVLVNAAAFTAVDRCETEGELAMRVNGEAPGLLAEHCRESGTGLVHVSTDYVLAGDAEAPCREDAPIAPRTAYGRTKAEGERRVLEASERTLVVRTSWVFGPGKNFVRTMLEQAAGRPRGEAAGPLRVVADQTGCPTYADDLAGGIQALATLAFAPVPADDSEARRPHRAAPEGGLAEPTPNAGDTEKVRGILHLCGTGETTWWGFARAILDQTGFGDLEIEQITTEELDLLAKRPHYSVLDCGRAAALGVRLRRWEEGLRAYLDSPEALCALKGAG